MRYEIHQADFTPKELAAVTGITPGMQRDWRRHGYLPERRAGWARFTLGDAAAVAVRKIFAEVGGPSFANSIISDKAWPLIETSVVLWALEEGGWAFNGDSAKVISAGRESVERGLYGDRFDVVADALQVDPEKLGRLLHYFPREGKILLTSDFPESDVAGTPGAMITVPLYLLGAQIAAQAGKPLLTFWFKDE